MAPAIYPLYKRDLLTVPDTNLDLDNTTANISPYGLLVDTGVYTFSAAHEFFTSLSGIVGAASGIQITTPTLSVTAVFDGDDITFTSVSGASVEAIVIYRQNAGATSTHHLVSYYDTAGGGLPVTPNGGNITVSWNASGIFQLSDVEAKRDVVEVGRIGPLGVYSYRYRWEPDPRERPRPGPQLPRHLGLIAQEVELLAPHAVSCLGRYKHVDYPRALDAASRAA